MTTAIKSTTQNELIPWWIPLLQGISSIIFGLLLVTSTGQTVFFLVTFIGIYWLIEGIFAIVSIFIDSTAWGWKLLHGVIGIWAGVVVLNHPLASAVFLPWFVVTLMGFQGLVMGGVALYQAFRGAGWGTAVLGIMSILIGILLLGNTLLAAWILAIALGLVMIAGGAGAVYLAWQMKP